VVILSSEAPGDPELSVFPNSNQSLPTILAKRPIPVQEPTRAVQLVEVGINRLQPVVEPPDLDYLMINSFTVLHKILPLLKDRHLPANHQGEVSSPASWGLDRPQRVNDLLALLGKAGYRRWSQKERRFRLLRDIGEKGQKG
jgi:hypothetical protein